MADVNDDTGSAVLRGQVCLVTGGSRTLGAAIARRFAQNGAHVVVNYHESSDAAQTLCAELTTFGVRAIAVGADATQPDGIDHLLDATWAAFGRLDMLINGVGPYVDTPFVDLALEDFDRIWAGNGRSTFLVGQNAGRRMRDQGHGQIINIAATDYVHRSHSIYGLAKSAVVYLTEALALELAPTVRVNALAPDLIADNEDMSAEITSTAIGATPLARLVTRAEIADVACLLCTPAFAFMTGQTITLDGGRTIPRIALG